MKVNRSSIVGVALAVAGIIGCRSHVERDASGIVASGVTVNGSKVCEVEWREERDGLAVRYRLPEGKRIVSGEDTVWTLPEDAMCWYQIGICAYESPYSWSKVKDVPRGQVLSLPITFRLEDGSYRLITEANLVDYTDLAVTYEGQGRFVAKYHAEKGPFEQTGSDTTPWRVMIVAKDLNELANSDLVRRLCPPPTNEKSVRIAKPGRSTWHWLASGAPKYAEQKSWYDQTAALGFEYYLIDDGWRDWHDGEDDQWACLKKVIDYGKSVGVKTAMWVHSKEMAQAETRRPYLEKVVKAGAVGIKIDFMPPCDSRWCKWYEETLSETAELGLFVDFHGAVKPTGRERTWPHELTREAIRGHEWHITDYHRILPPEHDTILPFCRLVQGHGDYTPVVFRKDQLVHFTWPRQLAQGVIMSSRFLCFGDHPTNYLSSPMVEIVKALSPTYDETVVLPGSEIGGCVVMARRSGKTWFLAVENGSQVRSLNIPLSFLKNGKWRLTGYRDDPSGRLDACVEELRVVSPVDSIPLKVRSCGGYVAMLTQIEEEPCPVNTNFNGRENIEWSIAYSYHLTDDQKNLPRVLLIGDSICNGYQERVKNQTEGMCNVGYWASSYCVTSPDYPKMLEFYLNTLKYDVIHFNNGLHSLDKDTATWAKALESALKLIRRVQPKARIVWATSTPLKDPVKTAKVKELNAAAREVVDRLGGIETNDLFSLLDPYDRDANWQDVYHHKSMLRDIEARQIVQTILSNVGVAN